jgi:hypothetical protein
MAGLLDDDARGRRQRSDAARARWKARTPRRSANSATCCISGFGNVLREQVGNIDIRIPGPRHRQAGRRQVDGLLGDRELSWSFPFKHQGWRRSAESTRARLMRRRRDRRDRGTRGRIEGIGDAAPAAAPAAAAAPATTAAVPRNVARTTALESIPAAPIQRHAGGVPRCIPTCSACCDAACRRVGLELRRHGRGEIPNPAAHKSEIVLLDVPPRARTGASTGAGASRRLSDSTKVVLLILQAVAPARDAGVPLQAPT